MTPEQWARLEQWARTSTTGKHYVVPDDDSLFPALTAALAHIDALEARVGELEANGLDLDVLAKAYGWTYDIHGGIAGLVAGDQCYEPTGIVVEHVKELQAERDALTAERDALLAEVERLKVDRYAILQEQGRTELATKEFVDALTARAEQAEREREEARALVRHLQSELRAEVDGCKEAERTAAALREALCRHGIHDVTCAKRRSLFTLYEAVPCDCGFDAALAPTKAHDFECGLTQGQVPYCTCGLDLTPSAAPGEGETR